MFDDLPHNLETAHRLGMTTVLVACGMPTDHPEHHAIAGWAELPPHIHHRTDELATFLHGIGEDQAKQEVAPSQAVTESAA
jgi:putative hydrolase of the HAD superfamily